MMFKYVVSVNESCGKRLDVPERIEYKLGVMVYRCHLSTPLITSSQPLMLLLAVFVYDPLT